MADTAAAGVLADSKELLRTSLATCTYFQSWQGNSWDLATAKSRIYLDSLPEPDNGNHYTRDELERYRPFALIYKSSPIRFSADAEPGGFRILNTLGVMLEQDIPEGTEHDISESERLFENTVGQIMATFDSGNPGLIELSAIAHQGYINIIELEDEGPETVPPEKVADVGLRQRHYLFVTWGVPA